MRWRRLVIDGGSDRMTIVVALHDALAIFLADDVADMMPQRSRQPTRTIADEVAGNRVVGGCRRECVPHYTGCRCTLKCTTLCTTSLLRLGVTH
jgi:hypothetical protein